MANLVVDSVLKAASEKQAKLKTTDVFKAIDIEIDEGNLLAVDRNPIDVKKFRDSKEAFLRDLSRDNIQLLLNRLWELPVEKVEEAVVAKLPDCKTRLPREKPIPKKRATTKWEEYAKLKGIQKKKKSRMVYDEESKEYKPRWGYKRANDPIKEWVLEVPDHADPYEDQFAKLKKEKKERMAKNELQRLRNISKNMKNFKGPGIGILPTEKHEKEQISKALHEAKRSTASVGKFTDTLAKEKPAKNLGKKRKFESNFGSIQSEKKRALDILGKINSSEPVINKEKAGNMSLAIQQKERRAAKREGKQRADTKGRRSKSGGKPHSKGHFAKKGKGKGSGPKKRGKQK